MKGQLVIDALKKKLRVTTDASLAPKLGITGQAIQNWRKRKQVTARQIAGLVNSARGSGSKDLENEAITPVVEFHPIKKGLSKQGAKQELFETGHPYMDGLRRRLSLTRGIYIFFDSRGQAIYVGKTSRQTLWKEMTGAFNRARGDVQSIKRVKHPSRKQDYTPHEEKARQIRSMKVPLHELAFYFSAYAVAPALIAKMEAMLVRSFANDLLNIRMERFIQKQPAKRRG